MTLKHSWIDSANTAQAPFPLNNLPYGVFSTSDIYPRCGVAIGDYVLDLHALETEKIIDFNGALLYPNWNAFMVLGRKQWNSLRQTLIDVLIENSAYQTQLEAHLFHLDKVTMHLPIVVSEFTDFYSCKHHASNVGTMLRGPEKALSPNWLHIPIAYNARASTVVVSGTDITRPKGQTMPRDATAPLFGPSKRLDLELEMGAIVGVSSDIGTTLTVEQADDMIFGYVLLNDWSARDIQAWEYQPLGPFQAKAFATSISPWIVTVAALEPFRTSTPAREHALLPYLKEPRPMLYDIDLQVSLATAGKHESIIANTNYKQMYYSAAQQLAHHASSGCAMRVGDLLGSGTISGPDESERGSLLELTWGGKQPLTLNSGELRTFIEDGDTLTLRGSCQGDGFVVGFGECSGKVTPSC